MCARDPDFLQLIVRSGDDESDPFEYATHAGVSVAHCILKVRASAGKVRRAALVAFSRNKRNALN
jgi:hypothetical protein